MLELLLNLGEQAILLIKLPHVAGFKIFDFLLQLDDLAFLHFGLYHELLLLNIQLVDCEDVGSVLPAVFLVAEMKVFLDELLEPGLEVLDVAGLDEMVKLVLKV